MTLEKLYILYISIRSSQMTVSPMYTDLGNFLKLICMVDKCILSMWSFSAFIPF